MWYRAHMYAGPSLQMCHSEILMLHKSASAGGPQMLASTRGRAFLSLVPAWWNNTPMWDQGPEDLLQREMLFQVYGWCSSRFMVGVLPSLLYSTLYRLYSVLLLAAGPSGPRFWLKLDISTDCVLLKQNWINHHWIAVNFNYWYIF